MRGVAIKTNEKIVSRINEETCHSTTSVSSLLCSGTWSGLHCSKVGAGVETGAGFGLLCDDVGLGS